MQFAYLYTLLPASDCNCGLCHGVSTARPASHSSYVTLARGRGRRSVPGGQAEARRLPQCYLIAAHSVETPRRGVRRGAHGRYCSM
ncbi:protein of unknown function [Cupriavidus taiwanensis]|uniref:Uncharacterized protein n=1 Tax=Cupriavidus taiwanensis TaxID=164546 RepID=A0A7Z7JDG8_9BURK|nr:protein of unknown function [Cupriavidus taiwanensis]SOZ11049.1 protein of unknown function [Cupriavidus taiwanensis]SOZ42376.1 protein of unknown function [Cupriavidus taiwanensis]SPC21411.1 protein of unknown function [Cupriavidus taiwanensis]